MNFKNCTTKVMSCYHREKRDCTITNKNILLSSKADCMLGGHKYLGGQNIHAHFINMNKFQSHFSNDFGNVFTSTLF